jgi:hypothetical protein
MRRQLKWMIEKAEEDGGLADVVQSLLPPLPRLR